MARFSIEKFLYWTPPADWQSITTIDAHTAGEPLRIILAGFPDPIGETILERRSFLREQFDYLRTALMWEPRGHADMYGCVLTPPVSEDADFGILFLHNEGYSTMCGHAIIAIATVALQTGMMEPAPNGKTTTIKIDTPAGLITANAVMEEDSVTSVSFLNVPSFVYASGKSVEVGDIGKVRYDIAFGGAFYAFVDAPSLGLELIPENYSRIIDYGKRIKHAVMEADDIKHPTEEDLSFLYGTIFTAPAKDGSADSRNVCVFADGEVDRSPTGTGVSARMALHYRAGDIQLQQPFVIESILGTRFTGSVEEATTFHSFDAVIPRVEGNAYITGIHNFLIDPADPLKNGFLLR